MRLQLNIVQLQVIRPRCARPHRGGSPSARPRRVCSPHTPHLFALALTLLAPTLALAEDRVDTTVTWFGERRVGDRGGLNIVHPQFDFGVDAGENVGFTAGYDADIVSGATLAIYSVDAVTTATTFSDTRHSGHAGLQLRGRRSSLEVGYTHARERDYRSHVIFAGGAVDLPGKNTTFSLSYSHNIDSLCDLNNGDATELERQPLSGEDPCFLDEENDQSPTVTRAISIDTTQAAITQNLSPKIVMQVGVHGQIVRGFQSNPYRRVRVGEYDAQENVPTVRDRGAGFLRLNIALPSIRAKIGLMGRGYVDNWGVYSGTVEVDYHQYLGRRLLFRLRARGYEQTGATFFKDAQDYMVTGAAGRYFTGDRELAPMRDLLIGGKLSLLSVAEQGQQVWGVFDELSFNLKGDAMWTDVLTPTVPGGNPPGPLPDAIVVQLGLLLRY